MRNTVMLQGKLEEITDKNATMLKFIVNTSSNSKKQRKVTVTTYNREMFDDVEDSIGKDIEVEGEVYEMKYTDKNGKWNYEVRVQANILIIDDGLRLPW